MKICWTNLTHSAVDQSINFIHKTRIVFRYYRTLGDPSFEKLVIDATILGIKFRLTSSFQNFEIHRRDDNIVIPKYPERNTN